MQYIYIYLYMQTLHGCDLNTVIIRLISVLKIFKNTANEASGGGVKFNKVSK